jgi:EAL domain-containing protein (putative c-di-GMP-specific phosphodiesterase class I)
MARTQADRAKVLLAEDEALVARGLERVLRAEGYDVQVAADGHEAVHMLEETSFDVVITDIQMPGPNGIELLRRVRERSKEVPVVLMTGNPKVETAVDALELGAIHYLLKPINTESFCKAVEKALLWHDMAKAQQEAMAFSVNFQADAAQRDHLQAAFERALQGLWIDFQPIVRWADRTVFGYEALVRSEEPTLSHPQALLQAAEQLHRLHDLGRKIRLRAYEAFVYSPETALLFINIDPYDLLDEELYDANSLLSRMADRTVLEITERATLDQVLDVRQRLLELRRLGFRIALDDLGAGYAGLNSFALLEPELVKLDMSLVRDVEKSPVKQKLIRSMTSVCSDLGIPVVAEGVETDEERDSVIPLGCNLVQGYLFARPGPPFPVPVL